MNVYNPKTYKRFPWKEETIDLLIDLYASKIDIFLDPARTQLPAWKWIVSELKKTIKDNSNDMLTVMRVSNKFTSLKKKFKILFFDPNKTDVQKQKIFPFYTKMCDLFTDYATKQLHNSSLYNHQSLSKNVQETVNESINEADVTSYVVQLLNEEDMDKTSLTILPYDEQENFSEHVSSVDYSDSQSSHFTKSAIEASKSNSKTENEKVRIKLAEIPSDAIYIHKEKMRIDPNTPFNRHINSSTILNQRSLLLHHSHAPSMKRKLLSDLEPYTKKRNNPIAHSSHRLSKNFSDDEYMIEALDECELSDITMRRSKAIYHDSSSEVSQDLSPGGSIATTIVDSTKENSQLRLSPEQQTIHSIMEVPSFPAYDDDSTIEAPRLKLSDTIRCVPREIKPKKLNVESSNLSGTSQVSLMRINDDQPPVWFQNFLKRYDADIKNINSKLDRLLNKKESTSPVLIHPKVLKIKRDSI